MTETKQYQEKFMTLDEAMNDAKKSSSGLKTRLAVIQSKRLFYVDSNINPQDRETLHAIFENGKKVKA